MKEVVKLIWKEASLPNYTMKQRLIVWYFFISLFLVFGIGYNTGILATTLIVINFGNAVSLIKKVNIPDNETDD